MSQTTTNTRSNMLHQLKQIKQDLIQNMRFDRQGSRYDHARKIDALDTVISILDLVQVEDLDLLEHFLMRQAAALNNSKLKIQDSRLSR